MNRTAKSGPPLVDIARIVLRKRPPLDPVEAHAILLRALTELWPRDTAAVFTMTPGGFLRQRFPRNWAGGCGWASRAEDLDALVRHADPLLDALLSKPVTKAARARTRFLTIGVDLIARPDDARHAELVAVIECATGRRHWTGKSYPTSDQAHTLVHVIDLRTHLFEFDDGTALVLGCHDLNMFSARAYAKHVPRGRRRRRCNEMYRMLRNEDIRLVLHHPHGTDSPNVWRTAWAGVRGRLQDARALASGIAHYPKRGQRRQGLTDVLASTKFGGGIVDIVVSQRRT